MTDNALAPDDGADGVAITLLDALNERFLNAYPIEAARTLESMDPEAAAAALQHQPVNVIANAWSQLSDESGESVISRLPDPMARDLLNALDPRRSSMLLRRLEPERRDHYLALLPPATVRDIRSVMQYPADTAGGLMDVRVKTFRPDMTVEDAEAYLRGAKPKPGPLLILDDQGRLDGVVELQRLAIADPDQALGGLAQPARVVEQDTAPREDVVAKFEAYRTPSIPIVDFDGRVMGVIHQDALVRALHEETSLDIQTMVGVSKDERALSDASFSVMKRLPWLHINLLTAFLAASVVGLFESTIAQFTALAVLLPVVAGQSGNTGAQALAVTMRGLAVREITLRHWPRVVRKELLVGLVNGVAVAITTALGVLLWSQSFGLALVIGLSMVLSMVAAGFSGALIPITLQRLGQDPAQSSSIILTTVTDIVGFFSFLGIATVLAGLL